MFGYYGIILGLFALSGVVMTVWGWRVLRRAKTVKSWPVVSGVVVSARMPESEFDSPAPNVVFRYELNGKSYEQTQDFGGQSFSPEFCKEFVGRYPTNTQVQIFYNPADPAQATLEPGLEKGDWMIFIVGVLVTVFGVGFLIGGL